MLRTLGWDVGNPAEVVTEIGADFVDSPSLRADYVLQDRDSGVASTIVEAKALGRDLAEALSQVADYCEEFEDVRHGVVTDGNTWILFEINDEESEEHEENDEDEIWINEIARFSICEGDAVTNAVLAQKFANRALLSVDVVESHLATISHLFVPTDGNADAENTQASSVQSHTLASLRDMQVPPVPTTLILPENYEISVPHPEWRDWVVQVAIFLFVWSENYLDEYDEDDLPLPIHFPRSRRLCIVNDEPKHDNGDEFEEEFQVAEGVYVELDFHRRTGSQIVCAMLKAGEIDPAEVFGVYD